MSAIFGVIAVMVVAYLVVSGRWKKLFNIFNVGVDSVANKVMDTVEGISTAYDDAIQKIETEKEKIRNQLARVLGTIRTKNDKIAQLHRSKEEAENTIKSIFERGEQNDAMVNNLAGRALACQDKISIMEEDIKKLETTRIPLEKVYEAISKKHNELKEEKSRKIEEYKMNKTLKSSYDCLAGTGGNVDRFIQSNLDAARESIESAEILANGSETVMSSSEIMTNVDVDRMKDSTRISAYLATLKK